MPIINRNELERLEEIVKEPALPSALSKEMNAASKVLKQLMTLNDDAGRECRQMLDGRDEYRNAEPLRLLEMMRKGKKVSTEDILEDLAVYDVSHALALARTVTTRKMVNRQAVELGHGILRRHSEDILKVVAEAVVNDQMTPALIDAWGRVEKMFRWRMPLIHSYFRVTTLRAHQITPVMRRCWADLQRGSVSRTELDSGLTEIRFLDEWPEFAEMPQ